MLVVLLIGDDSNDEVELRVVEHGGGDDNDRCCCNCLCLVLVLLSFVLPCPSVVVVGVVELVVTFFVVVSGLLLSG